MHLILIGGRVLGRVSWQCTNTRTLVWSHGLTLGAASTCQCTATRTASCKCPPALQHLPLLLQTSLSPPYPSAYLRPPLPLRQFPVARVPVCPHPPSSLSSRWPSPALLQEYHWVRTSLRSPLQPRSPLLLPVELRKPLLPRLLLLVSVNVDVTHAHVCNVTELWMWGFLSQKDRKCLQKFIVK